MKKGISTSYHPLMSLAFFFLFLFFLYILKRIILLISPEIGLDFATNSLKDVLGSQWFETGLDNTQVCHERRGREKGRRGE